MSGWRELRRITGLVATVLAMAGSALAQKPSPADIDQMFPPTGSSQYNSFPSYKWSAGAHIRTLIITGAQRGVCIDIATSKLQREVALIRETVPALRNMREPERMDWLPTSTIEAPLLLALETKNSAIEQELARYGAVANPQAKQHHYDRHTRMLSSFGNGFGVAASYIAYAYSWTVTTQNLSDYSEEICRNSGWESTNLAMLLGGGRFRVISARWSHDKDNSVWRLLNRLFLRALYSCPSSPPSEDCLKATMKTLVAERWTEMLDPVENRAIRRPP